MYTLCVEYLLGSIYPKRKAQRVKVLTAVNRYSLYTSFLVDGDEIAAEQVAAVGAGRRDALLQRYYQGTFSIRSTSFYSSPCSSDTTFPF